ncbi:hypothetical protein K0M31_000586, partial [Melipona bicolor]
SSPMETGRDDAAGERGDGGGFVPWPQDTDTRSRNEGAVKTKNRGTTKAEEA